MRKLRLDLLQCPVCRSPLSDGGGRLSCSGCDRIDESSEEGSQIDLRPKEGFQRDVTFDIDPSGDGDRAETFFGELQFNSSCSFNPAGLKLPRHLTETMASYIPSPDDGSVCLDLGCGGGGYGKVLEKIGYEWIGCDYSNKRAPLLADAHSLPFVDESFDFVISLAVLEHLRYPPVALREVFRTMKPGATFLGSVTYLTPFHDAASYYNMTHEGVYSSLRDAGFEVDIVAGEKQYMGIHAICQNGLFLGAQRKTTYSIANVLQGLSRLWWKKRRKKGMDRSDETMEMLINTGGFTFVARRPE